MAKPLDDSQLLRLAADPRNRLFTPLRGATVFGPVVAVAGLLPCVIAMLQPEFNDTEAAWCLRALDAFSATELQDLLEPGRNGLGHALSDQPPLICWLQALVVPRLGSVFLDSWRVISTISCCALILSMYSLGRRIGGPSFGLLTTLLLCGHPVILRMAASPGPSSLGILCLAGAVWGFMGHLEGPPQLVSWQMLAGAIAWGLGLLTVGPIAIVLFIPMFVHSWLLHVGHDVVPQGRIRARLWQLWLGIRTVSVFIVTALSFSGWWLLMMMANHGPAFWHSWWTGEAILSAPMSTPQSIWRIWLSQNTFLCGWLIVGLVTIILELRKPETEVDRRRSQFVLGWWLTALALRIIFDIPQLRRSQLIEAWDALLLLPTIFLVARGIKAMVLRNTEPVIESLIVTATIGLYLWRISGRIWLGAIGCALSLTVLIALPFVIPYFRRGARPWSERDWRRLMQFAVIAILAGHIASGVIELPRSTPESIALSDLRRRLSDCRSLGRVTLNTANSAIPESLLFVLRSRCPTSQFVIATADERSPSPDRSPTPATELYVEWLRPDQRVVNEIPPNRHATGIGDPLRFRNRRLTVNRLDTRPH